MKREESLQIFREYKLSDLEMNKNELYFVMGKADKKLIGGYLSELRAVGEGRAVSRLTNCTVRHACLGHPSLVPR